MSFSGTQEKCKACEKTVYPVESLSADGIPYHKSCFRCSHCKGTLKLSNYSSMEGVVYCKPHFEQLFKETGSFAKNFVSPVKAERLTPELTRSPSKAAGMFSGTQEKCATCGKTAYPLEKGDNMWCYCKLPAVLKTSHSAANPGRMYWANNACSYFRWLDKDSQPRNECLLTAKEGGDEEQPRIGTSNHVKATFERKEKKMIVKGSMQDISLMIKDLIL